MNYKTRGELLYIIDAQVKRLNWSATRFKCLLEKKFKLLNRFNLTNCQLQELASYLKVYPDSTNSNHLFLTFETTKEMERIGWDVAKGRQHLIKTYGKKEALAIKCRRI
ncbi:MAG: hypothetical protein HC908_01660 [Calothrix sp. SM1_7_51]|nr:hypothetical protein [Calothrix sp. SM1_7_51]